MNFPQKTSKIITLSYITRDSIVVHNTHIIEHDVRVENLDSGMSTNKYNRSMNSTCKNITVKMPSLLRNNNWTLTLQLYTHASRFRGD